MENDYKRNYFWIKRDLKGNKHYYFKIKGQYHEVSEEVYKTCYNSFKKEEREKEKRSEFKVSSLDQLDNNNTALVDKIADSNNQYDTFNVNEEVENVMNIINQLSEEDKMVVSRARKVQRFLSQPFFVAGQFTGLEGRYVPISDTIQGFKEIIEGKYDDIPESYFLNCGSIDDVLAKVSK